MSSTPRTDAAYFKKGATMYDLAGQMKLVELELNAANDFNREIRERNEWLNDKIDAASQRIKRLEEACREMVSEEDTYIRLQTWLKAKEAK